MIKFRALIRSPRIVVLYCHDMHYATCVAIWAVLGALVGWLT